MESGRVSAFSNGSRQETMTEMKYELHLLKELVKEDEWFNIPAPVRKATDGLIHFSEKVSSKLIDNAESAHRKILIADDRMKKIETAIKTRLDIFDSKVERELKRIYEKVVKQIDENKHQLVHANETSMRTSQMIIGIQEKAFKEKQFLEKANEVIQKLVKQVDTLETENKRNDGILTEMVANLKTVMEVPGLLGSDKKKCAYADFPMFVKEMHEFREESGTQMVTLMKSKLKEQEKVNEKNRVALKDDLMEFMRIQEREIKNLRIKFEQLDSEMAGLLGEEDEQSSSSKSKRSRRRPVASPRSSRQGGSHHSKEKSPQGNQTSRYEDESASDSSSQSKSSNSLRTSHATGVIAKDYNSEIIPIMENTAGENNEAGVVLDTKVDKTELSGDEAPDDSKNLNRTLSSKDEDMHIESPINQRQINTAQQQPLSHYNDQASFQDKLRGSMIEPQTQKGKLQGSIDNFKKDEDQKLDKLQLTRQVSHDDKKRELTAGGSPAKVSIRGLRGDSGVDEGSVKSRPKPTSITRRITQIFKGFSVGDDKGNKRKKGGKDRKNSKIEQGRSSSKSRPKSRSKKVKAGSTGVANNENKRLDIMIMHQIKYEKKVDQKVMALRKMLTDFSKAMWLQMNRQQTSSSNTRSLGRGSRQSPVAQRQNHSTQRSPTIKAKVPPIKSTNQVQPPSSSAVIASENSQSSVRGETPSESIASTPNELGPTTKGNQMVPANSYDSKIVDDQISSPSKPSTSQKADVAQKRSKKDSTFAGKGSSNSKAQVQKQTSFDISSMAKKNRNKQKVTPAEVSEAPSQAEDSQMSLRPDSGEDVSKIYSTQVAKKYHFVEVYLDHQKQNESVLGLYEKPKRRNSLEKLLTVNIDDSYLMQFNQSGLSSIGGEAFIEDGLGSIDQTAQEGNFNATKNSIGSKDPDGTLQSKRSRGRGTAVEAARGRQFPASSRMRDQNQDINTTFNSMSSHRSGGQVNFSPRQVSPQLSSQQSGVCAKCKDEGQKPCLEQIQILRSEFTIYIDDLFRKKMQEFISFIEEYVEVTDQTDPDQDNIIHAFYREHNTLQKTSENFRLLEYKRKKYLEKRAKSKSKSPTRETGLTTPQKTFLRSVYGPNENQKLEKSVDQANQEGTTFRKTGNAFRKLSVQPSTSNGGIDLMYKSTQSEYPAESNCRSTQQTSNSRLGRARNSSKPLTLTQQLPPTIEITSSTTTQRKASVFLDKSRQQLPIISTRKAHLTVDQRVWDADQMGSMITMPKANNDLEGQKVKHALATNNSDGFMALQGHHHTKLIAKQFDFQILHPGNANGIRNTIINQNSSLLNLTPVASKNAIGGGISLVRGSRPSMPLSVQFQEFAPIKN